MTEEKNMARTKSISDDELLSVFERHDAPYMTAGDVADEIGMSRQGVHERLQDLADDGRLESKTNGRHRGWWPA